ncbi:MAG: PLP-dependent aminotransferase family protein [Spirochaetia bacterium]
MGNIFSDRISDVPKSFIREILKVAVDPEVISFAGGLPNRDLFPVEGIRQASNAVLDLAPGDSLQYASSEGYRPLREWIAQRYREKRGLDIPVDNIVITSGSQQALDLLAKVILNKGDGVAIEEPGYLGAIQAFSVYQPEFHPVPVYNSGPEKNHLQKILNREKTKLFYCVPNFQNPSGITYTTKVRKSTAEVISSTEALLIEDDPYGELRFLGEEKPSFFQLVPEQTVLLGSFSKIFVPGFRIGWIACRDDILDKVITAKQASDLHTNIFSQRVLYQYLKLNNIDDHIAVIKNAYGNQRQAMVNAIREHFPPEADYTMPEGGMFLWVTLPKGIDTMDVFHNAIKQKVAFVPGIPFFTRDKGRNTMRLNYSCTPEKEIESGIARLSKVIKEML